MAVEEEQPQTLHLRGCNASKTRNYCIDMQAVIGFENKLPPTTAVMNEHVDAVCDHPQWPHIYHVFPTPITGDVQFVFCRPLNVRRNTSQ
jgi:hypothetical protein